MVDVCTKLMEGWLLTISSSQQVPLSECHLPDFALRHCYPTFAVRVLHGREGTHALPKAA